jgi:hypothetical protein
MAVYMVPLLDKSAGVGVSEAGERLTKLLVLIAAACVVPAMANSQTVGPAQPGETCTTLNADCANYCTKNSQNPKSCANVCSRRLEECRLTGVWKGSAKHTTGLQP